MRSPLVASLGLASAALVCASVSNAETKVDLQVDYEGTAYFSKGERLIDQSEIGQTFNNSIAAELEIYKPWNDGSDSVTFKPYYRFDEADEQRNHGDVRELIWNHLADEYELKVGIGKVFWGVTESQHLVDIVNQTDGVEQIDGEEKLGQPMVQLMFEKDWGNLDLFVLPYHRERTFVGKDGRQGFGIDLADGLYQAEEEESHVDVAARWYNYWGELEYAVSYFQGTSREPSVGFLQKANGDTELLPYYPLIKQLGVELQYLAEGWAWKFEGIYRDGMLRNDVSGQGGTEAALFVVEENAIFPGSPVINSIADSTDYFATTAGFEYTQVGIFETRVDLGWVFEHLYDSRGNDAGPAASEHDVLLGTRWVANDAADSELLFGVIYDYDYSDYAVSLEGSTRIVDGISAELEARFFEPSDDNPQSSFADEDFVKLTLSFYL